MIDVVVAGGGPVGLAAALYAARAGLEVEILEPRTGAIDKACGEGLMPGAVAALCDLGVAPPGVPLRGIRYVAGDLSVAAEFRRGQGLGVRRTSLHAAMSEVVIAQGISIRREAVREVVSERTGVLVNDTRARFLIAADGLHSPVRRMLGLDRPVAGRRRYGLRCHVDLAPWSEFVEVHWGQHAEAYVTPVAPDLVCVALLTGQRASFDDMLQAFPALRDRVETAKATTVRGAGPLRQRSSRRVAGRSLLVGDASGYVDALTGEGIALGLTQARAAVAAIASGRPARYEIEWRRAVWRHWLLTSALLRAARIPSVRDTIVSAAAARPGLFSAAVNELARPA